MTATAQPPTHRRTPLMLLPFRLVFLLVRTVVMTIAAILGGLATALQWAAAGRPGPAVATVPLVPPAPPSAPPAGRWVQVVPVVAGVAVVAVVLSVLNDRAPFRVMFVIVPTLAIIVAAAVLGGLAVALRRTAAGRTKPAVAAVPPAPVRPPTPVPPPAPRPLPVAARTFPARPAPKVKSGGATGQRVLFIAAVVGVVAVVLSVADDGGRRKVSAPPAPTALRNLSPHRLQEHAADNAIVGGAMVALRSHPELVAPVEPAAEPDRRTFQFVRVEPAPPVPGVPAVPTFRVNAPAAPSAAVNGPRPRQVTKPVKVRSESPHPTRDAALADALEVARRRLADQLQELDPPINTVPSAEFVRLHIRPGSDVPVNPTEVQRDDWVRADLDPNRVWVELEVTGLTSEEVRHLRSNGRLANAGGAAAIPLILALALYGFLRFDAWTKGYLTVALGVGMAALAGGAVAMLTLMR